jgi:amidase
MTRLSFLVLLAAMTLNTRASAYDATDKSIGELEADLAAGRVTSVELVRDYESRIARFDPLLHAVIAINPDALVQAKRADLARKSGAPQGLLAGVPILIKDNIETGNPMATTAGSLALKDNVTGRDAPLVAKLRAAGAIILGKTNLSEWANIRSSHSISGWSAIGGQARNPYDPRRSPCGSSAGSGIAVAASFAAAAIGTETDGSISCPSSVNGVVGFKPTVGLVSRTHIVPISHTQDTPGPMTRTVADAALMLSVIAGPDPADPATAPAVHMKTDYLAALDPTALKGVRIGVLRFATGVHPETDTVFEAAVDTLRRSGATLVEITEFPRGAEIGPLETLILRTELKADLATYLASTDPKRVPTRTLADLIAFDKAHAAEEMALFGQDTFEKAEATSGLGDPVYLQAKALAHQLAGTDGIDRLLVANHVTALIAPTLAPPGFIDPVLKDRYVGGGAGSLAAVAGYPHLTVPMGQVDGLPVGLSFIGPAWSEATLLAYGYAYEQASHARKPPSLDALAVASKH